MPFKQGNPLQPRALMGGAQRNYKHCLWRPSIPLHCAFGRWNSSKWPFLKCLCAKQMILNKNGDSSPLAKRLITVFPAILLAHTGARFRHLKPWQMSTHGSCMVPFQGARCLTSTPSCSLKLTELIFLVLHYLG